MTKKPKTKAEFAAAQKKRERDERLAKAKLQGPAEDGLPPHSTDAEQAALGCVLLAGGSGSMAEVDELIRQLRPSHFYSLIHRELLAVMFGLRQDNHAVDVITVKDAVKSNPGGIDSVGGLQYLAALPDKTPTVFHFTHVLPILKDKAHRRWLLTKGRELAELATAEAATLEDTQARMAELFDASTKASAVQLIQLVTPKEARDFKPDPEDYLIGDGLITRQTFVTIGGEPGCGKSRLATSLAIALAKGKGSWQGYPVRGQVKTLILQTENTGTRLKDEFDAVPAAFDDWIKISRDLPNGLAFANPDFRRELTRINEQWPFGLLVVDPWNDVSAEEGQGDYAEALRNIMASFRGRKAPAVCIVAHLRKARADATGRRKTGRELLHELSGSLKLGSTSRTVFVVQPATPDMEDDRIVFELAKANDCRPEWLKEFGTRSAWHRRNGAFAACDKFDWEEWQNPGGRNEEKRAVTLPMIQAAMRGRAGMKAGELVKRIAEAEEVGESTVWRAIGKGGYAHKWLDEVAGVVALKEDYK